MNWKFTNKFLLALVIVLVLANIYLVDKYQDLRSVSESCIESQKANEKIVVLAKFFIEKILKADGELNVETVLELENAAKATGDEELRAQWQKFLATRTIEEAQQEIQNFLELIVNKIRTD